VHCSWPSPSLDSLVAGGPRVAPRASHQMDYVDETAERTSPGFPATSAVVVRVAAWLR
jgi:hypothetical protein